MSAAQHLKEHESLGIKYLVRYRVYLYLSTAQAIPSNATSTHTPVQLDITLPNSDPSIDDPLGVWSQSNFRFIVPAGFEFARLSGGIIWEANATGRRQMGIRKNASALYGSPQSIIPVNSATEVTAQTGTSTIVPVAAGDYFQLAASQDSGGNLNVTSGIGTWFSIELM